MHFIYYMEVWGEIQQIQALLWLPWVISFIKYLFQNIILKIIAWNHKSIKSILFDFWHGFSGSTLDIISYQRFNFFEEFFQK